MRKFALAALAAVLVLALAGPAWAECIAPPQMPRTNDCRVSAHGGGPGGSDVTVTASSTSYHGVWLTVVRQRNVRLPQANKGIKTVLSVEVNAEQSFTFRVPRGFGQRGATFFAYVQDIDFALNGCESGAVAVSNEF